MKDKIIIFLIGLLLGAIISTGSIYVYTIASNSNGRVMEDKEMFNNERGNTPPEMFDENKNLN